jgi:hypothetical protein
MEIDILKLVYYIYFKSTILCGEIQQTGEKVFIIQKKIVRRRAGIRKRV